MQNQDAWTSVGQQIRQARRHRGLTQDTLGEAIGVHKGAISKDERGAQPIPHHRLHAYCKLFDWDIKLIDEFVDGQVIDSRRPSRARLDYIAMTRAIRPLCKTLKEKVALQLVIEQVISARWSVPAHVFNAPIPKLEKRTWKDGKKVPRAAGDAP